ncbi:gluconate 2-dehydrogenase subunit 3 family protein [Paraglaciecola sp. L3A3]|uniref:gluconate 2-dehydrogenase subunit 3 family protein n=1 Tax=Paraglaciecola sp. L3A3 TaxID=2686358 RepID=UPI00131EB14F|nr:gluconate 2-dehydrogenase subunit 3 family protein [Paraglaciecola sp. L3A3]
MHKSAAQETQNQSPNAPANQGMTRRNLLIGIMASVGVATTVGCVENFDKSLASLELEKNSHPDNLRFYTANEYELLSILTSLIIPDTDTPGALAIGAPKMMDTLHADWASTESKEKQKIAISEIKQSLDKLAGQNFLTAPSKIQLSSLTELDSQAFSGKKNKAWGYRSVKSLIARFYYSSEVGATQELRYELVPGRWEACIPFEKVGRTWAA